VGRYALSPKIVACQVANWPPAGGDRYDVSPTPYKPCRNTVA
jgi:hypothetical protein